MYPYTFHVLVGCTPWDYRQLNYEALQVKGEGVGKGNHNDLIVRDVAQFQENKAIQCYSLHVTTIVH